MRRHALNVFLLGSVWASLFSCGLFRFSEPTLKKKNAEQVAVEGGAAGAGGVEGGAGGAAGAVELIDDTPVIDCIPGDQPCPDDTMRCFPASTLAGTDFCAPACTPGETPDSETEVCTESGAKLRRCHPNGSPDAAADCPNKELSCYRTSLSDNEGLCIKMPVCSKSAQCPNHRTCASDIVADLSPLSPTVLHLDHLNCMTTGCWDNGCLPGSGEDCLGRYYDTAVADICTPICDDVPCPPNYTCARDTSGDGSPHLCLPRMPGVRCEGDTCLDGICEDSGAGFKICTEHCTSDSECKKLNTTYDEFYCVEWAGGKHCVTPRPFHGANCDGPENCRVEEGELCPKQRPSGSADNRGECRVPCVDGTCAPRGGLPHTCLSEKDGCFPGEQGLPCQSNENCLLGLECLTASEVAEFGVPEAHICTKTCVDDAACARGEGYCGAGYCRLKFDYKQSCADDRQCVSGRCSNTDGKCLPPAEKP
jgi:hypothetical protein